MIIGGLEKFTLIDYPEHLAAIVFTQGCNFRCHFCYNPMLVVPSASSLSSSKDAKEESENDKLQNNRQERIVEKSYSQVSEDSLFEFLESRVGKLDAVVISGGEPTLHHDLPEFIKKIRNLGFKVKLDSNGTNSEMLKKLISENLLDYIAMDIKAPEKKYDLITGTQPDLIKIRESIKIIKEAGLPYEFRTTMVPSLHDIEDIKEMGELIKGAKRWYLQKFEGETSLVNKNFEGQKSFDDQDFDEMLKIARNYVDYCDFR